MKDIHIWGVKQNNLKNLDIHIPLGKLTVVCGPSGSGKSSLAFETLFAEGQRRFIESMSNYARQFLNKAPKPDIEGINNIPPAISIEQKNSVKSSRSTVGTSTELIDYLRLFFEKAGESFCPIHKIKTIKMSLTEAADKSIKKFENKRGYVVIRITAEDRLVEGKKLHALLIKEGFSRIITIPSDSANAKLAKENKVKLGDILELSDKAVLKKGLPKSDFYLVIDRMSFSKDERERLYDSLSLAFETHQKLSSIVGGRRALVVDSDGNFLKVFEDEQCEICGYTPSPKSSRLFSFNSPLGACQTCKGFGNILDLDRNKVIPNENLSLRDGALHPFTMPSAAEDFKDLIKFCRKAKIDIEKPWFELSGTQKEMLWEGGTGYTGIKGLFAYLEQIKYKMHVRVFISRYRSPFRCPDCKGSRLTSEALNVFVDQKSIADFSEMTIESMAKSFEKLTLASWQIEACAEIIKQINSRLGFLLRVGVNYLSLSRETRTLSGGEYQRIMLANQLGMGLSQTLYVLDEPTIGLHPRDNDRLISILNELRDLGNTVVIVEHDHDVINNAEHIIEMGPGSGVFGGEIIFQGNHQSFIDSESSPTSRYLRPDKNWTPLRAVRPTDISKYKYKISLTGCNGNNLKNVDLDLPLNRLVAVTGVSGSGKSTLISNTLYPALSKALKIEYLPAKEHAELTGSEHIQNVVMIDQSPVGKSARSMPVTYLKIYDAIRNAMAGVPESIAAGYSAGTFSLNVDGGRCPICRGLGSEEIDMMFMDNVVIPCDVCDSKRFRPEILEIKFKGLNIFEILNLTVSEAMNFFVSFPNIRKPLSFLKDVGLDYLKLGQPALTLSGGESQRLKIARELSMSLQKSSLYILDEPTTGLHFREVDLLMRVLNRLVDSGSSVLVVEHNQDVIAGADYIIDMGPDAGDKGGLIVGHGTPEEIMANPKSLTGQYLKRYLGVK